MLGCIAMDGGVVNVVESWSTSLQNNMPDTTQERMCPSLTQFSSMQKNFKLTIFLSSRSENPTATHPCAFTLKADVKVASCCWQDWVPWPQSNHSLLVSSLLDNQNGVGRNSWEHQVPVHQIELYLHVHCS